MFGQPQRPFLPSQLMNPMMGGMSFPWAGGKLPSNPNPLANAQQVPTTKADAGGIQAAMNKRAGGGPAALDPKFLKLLEQQLDGPFDPNARFSDQGDELDLVETIMEYESANNGEVNDNELGFYGGEPDERGLYPVRPDLTYGQIQDALSRNLKPKSPTVEKAAANMNLGKVPQGSGPQQMFNAMSMLGQARALVDPEKTLKQEKLPRKNFEGMIEHLAKKDGERYDFRAEKKDPKRQAIIKGLLGAVAGGGAGYLGGGGGIGSTLAGAAIGGAGGAGVGALGARSHNKDLHSTAKVLKNYGLLQPEYLRAALPLLKQGGVFCKAAGPKGRVIGGTLGALGAGVASTAAMGSPAGTILGFYGGRAAGDRIGNKLHDRKLGKGNELKPLSDEEISRLPEFSEYSERLLDPEDLLLDMSSELASRYEELQQRGIPAQKARMSLNKEKVAGAVGGAAGGGVGGGLLGALLAGGGNLAYQAYNHYKPGLQAMQELKNSGLPPVVQDGLFRAGKAVYPSFKPDMGKFRQFAGTGAAAGGGLGALFGGIDGHNEAKEEAKKQAEKEKQEAMMRELYHLQQMQATKSGAQSNDAPRLSAAGEDSGVSFKHDDQGHLTGADAFKTLDGYMKKAGLNSFQRQFFGRLIRTGMDESMLRAAVKTACDRFGDKVSADLNDGMEKAANWFSGARAAGPAIRSSLGKGILGKGLKNTKNFAKGFFKSPTKLHPRPGGLGHIPTPKAEIAGNTVKRTLGLGSPGRARKALSEMGTGAFTGAVNPYTGVFSDYARDSDGSINWGRLAQSAGVGAILGRVPGVQNMMRRGVAGEGAGYGGTAASNYLFGTNFDPYKTSQLGFGLFGASGFPGMKGRGALPGANNRNITRYMQHADPFNLPFTIADKALVKPLRKHAIKPIINAFKADPQKALRTAGMTVGGLGLGALPIGAYQGLKSLAAPITEKMDKTVKEFREPVNAALQSVTNTGDQVQGMLGGGKGWGGMLSNMFGGMGDAFKNNPWLLPLLLAGGGALGGGALGGKGGAAMGGIGLPLLFMLATGQFGGQPQQTGAPAPEGAPEGGTAGDVATGGGAAKEQAGIAPLPQQGQQNEMQRQMIQQMMQQQMMPQQSQMAYA